MQIVLLESLWKFHHVLLNLPLRMATRAMDVKKMRNIKKK